MEKFIRHIRVGHATKLIGFHVLFLTFLTFIAFFPTLQQTRIAPKDTFYPKIHGIFEDYFDDLSKIKQGRTQWFTIDQYTTEETSPSRIHIMYILLGRIAQLTGVSDIQAYYLSIFASLIIFYVFTVKIVTRVVAASWRIFTLLIIFLASPLPPYDMTFLGRKIFFGTSWWTYMDAYHRLTLRPHHFLASALLVGSVYYLLRFTREKKLQYILCIIICNSIAIVISAVPGFIFTAALLLSLAGVPRLAGSSKRSIFIADKRVLLGFFCIIVSAFVLLVYMRFQITHTGFPWNQMYRREEAIFRVEEYPYLFSIFIQSYGILLIFLPLGVARLISKRTYESMFITLVAMLPPVLYFLSTKGFVPITKIRFVYSAPYVFAGIAAVEGIICIAEKIKSHAGRNIAFSIITCAFLINALLGLWYFWKVEVTRKNIYRNIYIHKNYLASAEFLNNTTPKYSNILSTFYTGVFLPAFTMNKVFVGHEASTYNFWQKWNLASDFFSGKMTTDQVKELFTTYHIMYVFWDEGVLPSAYKSLVVPVWEKDTITIYKVTI